MCGDLQLLSDWKSDENSNRTDKLKRGYLWLHRATIAMRLRRLHLAERAFRNVVEQGTSLAAWRSLMIIYTLTNNTKNKMATICEISDVLGIESMKVIPKLPPWI